MLFRSDLLDGSFRTATIDTTWPASEGAAGLEKALDRICAEATDHVLADRNILILSDRAVSADRIPIPALLATAADKTAVDEMTKMELGVAPLSGEEMQQIVVKMYATPQAVVDRAGEAMVYREK